MSNSKVFGGIILVLALVLIAINIGSDDVSVSPSPTPSAIDTPDITETLWLWQQTSMNDDTEVSPDNSESYTLTLNTDGTINGKADCNNFTGSYEITGSNITFGPMATTRAFCGESSLDTQYLQDLSNAATYFTQEGDLYIDLQFDSGIMKFSE